MSDFIRIGFDISGVPEIVDRLRRTSDAVQIRLRDAMTAIGDDIERRAIAAAPVGGGKDPNSGYLRASVEARVWETPRSVGTVVRPYGNRPGQNKRNGNYAVGLFIERGLPAKRMYVRGHVVGKARGISFVDGAVKRGKTFKVRGSGYYRNRPAIAAQPWFSPAVEAVRPSIGPRIEAAIQAGITSEYYGSGG